MKTKQLRHKVDPLCRVFRAIYGRDPDPHEQAVGGGRSLLKDVADHINMLELHNRSLKRKLKNKRVKHR